EAVLRPFVRVELIDLLVRLQRRLECGNALIDALVVAGVIQEQRRRHLRGVLCVRLPAIERSSRREITPEANGKVVDDAAAEAEADRADLAGARGARLQPLGRGHEVLEHLRTV